MNILAKKELLGIFPEGTINRTNDVIRTFKYGAVSMAKKTNSWIVPFSITGKYKLFQKSVKIAFGTPYKVTGDLEVENNKLMKEVKELIEENHEK